MPSLPISGLTAGNPAQSADLLPMERSGVTYNVTAGSIAALASGGVGPGATGALPVFTSATTIGSSAVTDDGATLTYSGSTIALATGGTIAPPDGVVHTGRSLVVKASAGSSGLAGGNLTENGGDSSSGGAGGSFALRGGNTSGGSSSGGAIANTGGSGVFGGNASLIGGAGVTGSSGDAIVRGGISSSSGTNGHVRLGFPSNTNTVTANGAVAVYGNGATGAAAFYPAVLLFAALAAPVNNPFNGGVQPKDGAIVFCTDAKGPQDGGTTWGSTAAGSGTGAVLRYVATASHWVVIG